MSNFTKFDKKNRFLSFVVKTLKNQARFELMSYIFVFNARPVRYAVR